METEPDGGGTAARAPHRPVGGERREEARRRHPSHRVSLLSGYAWDLLPGSFSPAAARAAAAGNQSIPPSSRRAPVRGPLLIRGPQSARPGVPRAGAQPQRAVEPGVPSCPPRGLILLGLRRLELGGTGDRSDGCHPLPFSRWRREGGLAAAVPSGSWPSSETGGDGPARGRSDSREGDGADDGHAAWRAPPGWAARPPVSVNAGPLQGRGLE